MRGLRYGLVVAAAVVLLVYLLSIFQFRASVFNWGVESESCIQREWDQGPSHPKSLPSPDIESAYISDPGPTLWLYVDSFYEGYGRYTQSLAELMVLAKTINATFVLPVMRKGRMIGANNALLKEKASGKDKLLVPLPFDEFFDVGRLREFHPHVASHAAYTRWTRQGRAKEFVVCYKDKGDDECLVDSRAKVGELLQKAQMVVAKGGSAFVHWTYIEQGDAIPDTSHLSKDSYILAYESFKQNIFLWEYLVFKQEHYDKVDELLLKMGVDGPFNVVHWRAEINDLDYDECSEHIITLKDHFAARSHAEGHAPLPVVLMSSLNIRSSLQWGKINKANHKEQQTALHKLLGAGFKKLDQVTQDTDVSSYLLVWDLILAQKAESFLGCGPNCLRKTWCGKCNHIGSFWSVVARARWNDNKHTYMCWDDIKLRPRPKDKRHTAVREIQD